jgi:hypothetical protein
MARETVKTYQNVLESVRAFNKGLELSKRLREQIHFFQSWYYIPELDAVGPSKFIRYKDMDAFEYIRSHTELDGRVAEPVLSKWFSRLEPNSAEAAWVRQRVEALVGRYGKIVNTAAKFSVPKGWSINGQAQTTQPINNIPTTSKTAVTNAAVDGLWKAFLSLSSEDQKTLAARIGNRN